MRYAVLSDIHGNLEALEAVLRRLESEGIESYISLGDIVGYGADPSECIRLVRSLNPLFSIAGNHDWGVAGTFDLGGLSADARTAALWTREKLERPEMEYLKSLPVTYGDKNFTLVHGSLVKPEEFDYILTKSDAIASMRLMTGPLLFVGHSHAPAVYSLEGGSKRIVNTGSVGQPRDRDPRASFVIYDDDTADIRTIRVDYDIEKARKKIIDAGLPAFLGNRLREGV